MKLEVTYIASTYVRYKVYSGGVDKVYRARVGEWVSKVDWPNATSATAYRDAVLSRHQRLLTLTLTPTA